MMIPSAISAILMLMQATPDAPPPVNVAPVDMDSAATAPSDTAPKDPAPAGEQAVDAYAHSNANAGATPFTGTGMAKAFHDKAGIQRVVDRFVVLNYDDPVIGEIFKGHDRVRLTRTLFEQFCYILNAGCDYSGRDMQSSHKDLGIQHGDMNKLVENLQKAMVEEGVSFPAQNRFLSKLAPMRKDTVNR